MHKLMGVGTVGKDLILFFVGSLHKNKFNL